MSPNLVKALSHPLRAEIFELLAAERASPSQIAKTLICETKCVFYHVGVLCDLGCLQSAGTEPTQGGGTESFYEASPIAVAEYMLQKLPPSGSSSAAILRRIIEKGLAALEADTLDVPDSRLGCITATFDQEGFKKVSTILGEKTAAVMQTHRESKARLESGESEPISATIITGWFESPTERDMLGGQAT